MDVQRLVEPQDRHFFPASFAQRRIWFLDQLEPGTFRYNVPVRLWFDGELNAGVLEAALRAMVRRHESLRTTFERRGGEVLQAVGPVADPALRVVNLEDEAHAEEQAAKLAEAEFQQAFDLAASPLWRAVLLRLAPRRHLLALTLHHIIFDGWSLNVLIRELAALYQAFSAGHGSPFAELEWQYRQFAAWQKESMQGSAFERQMAYWRESLRGPLAVVELRSRSTRPSCRRSAGARRAIKLPAAMKSCLKSLARQEASTLPMVLLAAFDALLYRHTDQSDVIVGLPVAGRSRTETEGLIGFFVNTLALRVDVSGDPSFRELLRRVRRVMLDAYENQDVPFEMVVAEVQPERQPGRNPLFDVMFAYQGKPSAPLRLPDLTITVPAVVAEAAKFDLMLEVVDGEEMEAALVYDSDLLDAAEIEGMLRHFTCLLAEALARPDSALSQLSLITEAERQQVVVEWNRTTTDYPQRSLQVLFEEQVARTPDAIAVEFEEQRVSYAELNRRVNQAAHWLRERGVAPDTMVGLCVERGIEMLVGMLAIVKAGGAYVPLDPGYPAQRLAFMLEDSAAGLVLTESRFRRLFAAGTLCLDTEREQYSSYSTANPAPGASLDDLAYLIYTSGSTGQPKAALIPQRGVVRLVKSTNYVKLGPEEVILQFAPISFDASTFEIWGALLNGGRLVVFPPHAPSLDELGRVIRERGITTLWLTAALFHQMIEREARSLAGVRQLLAGGEALSAWHVREAQRQLPGCRLINGYGPTENTTFTCCAELRSEEIGNTVPIGRPIANTRAYVLDQELRPAPVGIPGELCIGGDGLARGYWKRPELTAERFVASALDPGGRLYRTGDLVRWRADGQIEFLRRMDQQVKIRGFRVEPGEIEATLLAHPAVRQAAVVECEPPSGGKILVAYVVGGATAEELRQHSRSLLPEYMSPSRFMLVSDLPLSPNGKVDRRALTGLALPEPEVTTVSEPPRIDSERRIAAIWQKALGLNSVGIHDNFMDLGGHSLLIALVHSQLQSEFRREFPMIELFRRPTIHDLARFLDGNRDDGNTFDQTRTRADRQKQAQQRIRENRKRKPHDFTASA